MEYRFLEGENPKKVCQCFRDSFSDYIVRFEMPFEKFKRHVNRNGVNFAISVGTYEGDRLVGFILNGLGAWIGRRTAYDAGTGLIEEHRGKGHSKRMFSMLKKRFMEMGVEQYLLEVIQGNDLAFSLYSKLGFTIERELSCFKISLEEQKTVNSGRYQELELRSLERYDWELLESFWNFHPSWQNTTASVERLSADLEAVGAFFKGKLVGYAIYDPMFGNIFQMAVRKGYRRKGTGSALLKEMAEGMRSGCKELRVLNVEKADSETIGFYLSRGFKNDVDQYEMLLRMDG